MQVRLRQLEEEDLPLLRDWRNDDELRMTFREYRLLNMINQRAWFAQVSTSREVEIFGIESQNAGSWALIGVCGLCNISWINGTAEISLYVELGATNRKKTAVQAMQLLANKGFNEFNLQRLWAEVHSFDIFKIRLLERCGYTREGELKRHIYKNGRYWNSYLFGLLKETP